MTNLIVVLHKMIKTDEAVRFALEKAKSKHDFNQIVDLGSGSGGAIPMVLKHYNETHSEAPLNAVLSDLYPNKKFVQAFNNAQHPNMTYNTESVNATELDKTPKGLKTMMNSFHHMPPKVAKSILKSAQDHNEPIMIFEMAQNKVPLLIWWLLLPLSLLILSIMTLFMTPAVKPMKWQQIVFTYIIPIIPLCYAWDGQVSSVRMYTFDDVQELIKDFKDDSKYDWEVGSAQKQDGKNLGYYIL